MAKTRTSLATIQERFEGTTIGQALISALVVAIVLIGIVWSIPSSAIKRTTFPAARPAGVIAGLDQSWSIFAPNPPTVRESISVHVFMPDGSDRVWTVPEGIPVIGQFTSYRWQKLEENLLHTQGISAPDFVHWVVRDVTFPQERPARVQVVLESQSMNSPGSDAAQSTERTIVYDETLPARP